MNRDHWSLIRSRWSAAEWRPQRVERDGGNRSMDMTWVTGRIAVGGGIWTAENMAMVARAGVSHILDMQIEFDDTPLAAPYNIIVKWTPTDDDFQPKPAELFERGVNFALQALDQEGTRLLVHCAAGVHRAPMMTLAILCSLSWNVKDAMRLIGTKRPVVDFVATTLAEVEFGDCRSLLFFA